jgi:hypothetical protein
VDKISQRAGVVFNLITIVNQFVFSYITIVRNTYDWTSFIFAFSWGFQDGCVETHSYQMMGFEFNSASDPFSIFNSVQAFAVFAFSIG